MERRREKRWFGSARENKTFSPEKFFEKKRENEREFERMQNVGRRRMVFLPGVSQRVGEGNQTQTNLFLVVKCRFFLHRTKVLRTIPDYSILQENSFQTLYS